MRVDREYRKRSVAKGNAGFTLIEVLLVVAILGILAAVVVVNFSGHQEKSKINATRMSIGNISTAVKLYEVNIGKYPTSLADLTKDHDSMNAPLDKVPTDAWGIEYQYKKLERGRFEVRSAEPDESFGTEDDITN